MLSLLLSQETIATSALMATLLGGYLSGSVPYGLILTRLAGMGDIRNVGSGNIGATNVLRAGGKKLAAITLLLDALKGLVPVLIAKQMHMDYAVLTALACVAGHLFPVWLKFKGGKGVATSLGVLLALQWQLGIAVICVWLLVFMISKISSLSALTAFGFSPLLAGVITNGDYQLTITTLVLAVTIFIKHHANIKRLLTGKEGKMSLDSKKAA